MGFYLVRETMNSGPTSIGDPKAGWEEKGSSSVHANGLTFSIPDMILKAKTDEQRELYFPNLEGRRFFLAKEYYNPGNLEEFAYRLYSDLESEGLHMESPTWGPTTPSPAHSTTPLPLMIRPGQRTTRFGLPIRSGRNQTAPSTWRMAETAMAALWIAA